MHYLKCLFFNFLVVFFANHILPGVDTIDQTKLPHVGGDLMFAAALGFLNSLICPILRLIKKASVLNIAGLVLVVNFVAYALLKVIPAGIQISTIQGYFLAAALVSVGGFLTNYFEMKHLKCCSGSHEHPPTEHRDEPRHFG